MKTKCKECKKSYTPIANVDPCFEIVFPGVKFACCGHGDVEKAYVDLTVDSGAFYKDLNNVLRLKGQDAYDFFSIIHDNIENIQNPIYNKAFTDNEIGLNQG